MAVVLLALATVAMPAQAQAPDCGEHDQCDVVYVPAPVELSGLARAGDGHCAVEAAHVPLACDAALAADHWTETTCQEASVDLPQHCGTRSWLEEDYAGFYSADSDDGNWGWSSVRRELTFTVEYNLELPCLPTTRVCGFTALICNDRDMDGACTNGGDSDDQLWTVHSSAHATDLDCDEDNGDEDEICDGSFLRTTVCAKEGVRSGAGTLADPDDPGPWNNADQFRVYIGAWAGTIDPEDPAGPRLGAGASAGSYDVGLDVAWPYDCQADDTGTPTKAGCVFKGDLVTSPTGLVADAGAIAQALGADPVDVQGAVDAFTSGPGPGGTATCVRSCTGASTIVAFAGGTGSVAVTGCTGSPVVAASPGVPAAAGAASGAGWFRCDFQWTPGAAAGGCFPL